MKKNLRMSLIGTNTLEHMRSSTHELRWQSVVLLQLPGPSMFAITRLGQSHGKPNFLRSVLTSFHLNSFPASHHWCVHFVLVPRALHCLFHKGLWRMFGDNKERAQPCRAQRSLRLHQGEKTLSPGREVGTWPMHGFYAATKLYPTLKLRKPPSQLAVGYSDICPPCFFATGIFCPAAHHHSQKFKRVSLPLVKFKISKRKMPDVDN